MSTISLHDQNKQSTIPYNQEIKHNTEESAKSCESLKEPNTQYEQMINYFQNELKSK
jgi:uncharacterized membrane protein